MAKVHKIDSIADLNNKCFPPEDWSAGYRALAMASARNLGGTPKDWKEGIQWLITTACETTEEGVVDEINFLID
jgi:hypothetical protein